MIVITAAQARVSLLTATSSTRRRGGESLRQQATVTWQRSYQNKNRNCSRIVPVALLDSWRRHSDGLCMKSSSSLCALPMGTEAEMAENTPAGAPENGLQGPTVLVWLRQDLRTHDNVALDAAVKAAKAAKGKVALVYVWSPEDDDSEDCPAPGGAMEVWYKNALASLDSSLGARYGAGARIIFLRGRYAQMLEQTAKALGSDVIHCNRRYEPALLELDSCVAKELAAAGIRLETHAGYLLQEPQAIRLDMTKWTGHFGTLTPFSMACGKLRQPPKPLPAPSQIPVHPVHPGGQAMGLRLDQLGLAEMPRRLDGTEIDWAKGIRESWSFGEEVALELLSRFIAVGLPQYEAKRQYADARAVSRLSPYLHSGELSARRMYHEMLQANAKQVSKTAARRLVWRDLAYWQLHHWPTLMHLPLRTHYQAQSWTDVGSEAGKTLLTAWQKGQTGYPLVDAGMRELWVTGWMQQSVRMVCAAFLTEYLNIHWKEGAAWFHDTLVDADVAINSMMWQNAGKSGIDQWNFTMNPASDAQDPTGDYTRRWVPEVAGLPNKYIHSPWAAPPGALHTAKVQIGSTYPERVIVDLNAARAQNIKVITNAKLAGAATWADAGGYDTILVPAGASTTYDGQKMRIFTKHEWRIMPNGDYAATANRKDGSASSAGGNQTGRKGGSGGTSSSRSGAGNKGNKGRTDSVRPISGKSRKQGGSNTDKGRRPPVRRQKGWRSTGSAEGEPVTANQDAIKRARRGAKQNLRKTVQTTLDSYFQTGDTDEY